MAALSYLIEYVYDTESPADSSAFIHLKGSNPPAYKAHADKEDYDILPEESKDPFITGLFDIAGVTELSSRAYRVWIMKSPAYTWSEIIPPVLDFISTSLGLSGFTPLPGSANTDGTGFTLSSLNQRRKL